MTSNKPYIVKAYYEWISDNDLTPYIMVDVNVYGVLVPTAYVTDGQIVLNISGGAIGSISLGDDAVELSARFGGKLEHIIVPYGAIGAIYAKETGAGTSLPIEHPVEAEEEPKATLTSVDNAKAQKPQSVNLGSKKSSLQKAKPSSKPKGGATLKVVK